MGEERKGKLRLEDLRIESFVTSAGPGGQVVGAELYTSYCTCSTCDVSTSGSAPPCGSACGYTLCCVFPTNLGGGA